MLEQEEKLFERLPQLAPCIFSSKKVPQATLISCHFYYTCPTMLHNFKIDI